MMQRSCFNKRKFAAFVDSMFERYCVHACMYVRSTVFTKQVPFYYLAGSWRKVYYIHTRRETSLTLSIFLFFIFFVIKVGEKEKKYTVADADTLKQDTRGGQPAVKV